MTEVRLKPISVRLQRRREYLASRLALMEAFDDLDTDGGRIALEALYSEMEFLREVSQTLDLMLMRRVWDL